MPDFKEETKAKACHIANDIIRVLNASRVEGVAPEEWIQLCLLTLSVTVGKFIDDIAIPDGRLRILANMMDNAKGVFVALDMAAAMKEATGAGAMSYWNYRIVRYHNRTEGYGLHEVHYNDQGRPVAMTAQGACFHSDMEEGPQAIVLMLEKALKDAQERGVLEQPAEWAK